MPTCGVCGNAFAFYELRPMQDKGFCVSCLHRNAENGNAETEQLRAELERVKAELDEEHRFSKSLRIVLDTTRRELAAANRREKVMREVVQFAVKVSNDLIADYKLHIRASVTILSEKAKAALQPDAGSTGERLFSESEVRPLVDALNAFPHTKTCAIHRDLLDGGEGYCSCGKETALAHAKELGL